MLDAGFIELCCVSYDGKTIKGLSDCLKVSKPTLYRVENGCWDGSNSYHDDSRARVSYNRKIPSIAFYAVREAMRQTRARG